MRVNVYSGGCLIETQYFTSESKAIAWASYFQDEGYKVRIV